MFINKDYCLFVLSFTVIYLSSSRASFEIDDIKFVVDRNHKFDVLIFTQRWPITGCIEWMEERQDNVCILPSQKDIWIIHGVWPTRFGSIGPAFCNESATFDLDSLKVFAEQLQQFWLNIEKGTPVEALWKHEWLKHGTCASVLPELDTENKYFGQGLAWLQQYTMSAVLAKSNVLPDNNYTLINIHNAVRNGLNHNPSIHCITDKHTGDIYLSEIRICFNKQLELIDCNGVIMSLITISYPGGQVITNCDLTKPIHYPSVVPKYLLDQSTSSDRTESTWRFPLVNVYKLIEMIKWFTL